MQLGKVGTIPPPYPLGYILEVAKNNGGVKTDYKEVSFVITFNREKKPNKLITRSVNFEP